VQLLRLLDVDEVGAPVEGEDAVDLDRLNVDNDLEEEVVRAFESLQAE
jgi:hypothetical protein